MLKAEQTDMICLQRIMFMVLLCIFVDSTQFKMILRKISWMTINPISYPIVFCSILQHN